MSFKDEYRYHYINYMIKNFKKRHRDEGMYFFIKRQNKNYVPYMNVQQF